MDEDLQRFVDAATKVAAGFAEGAAAMKSLHDPEATCVDLHRELARVLNRHSIDVLLNTPDHVLATMLLKTLDNYGEAIADRKRLMEGGSFDKAAWDALTAGLNAIKIPTPADQHGRAHEDQCLTNMDRALDDEYPSNKIDPDAKHRI